MNSADSTTSPCFRVVWPVDALHTISESPGRRWAVVLCVQEFGDTKQHFLDSGLAQYLAESGVALFALVGEEAERIHDALDWVLEEIGADDVVTSWHDQDDLEDIVSFVTASSRASGLTRIVAVLDEATELGSGLRKAMDEAVRLRRQD